MSQLKMKSDTRRRYGSNDHCPKCDGYADIYEMADPIEKFEAKEAFYHDN
ncbi:MAG: hypothetical protein ACEQSB_00035 [Undibacterium sp.]